MDPDDRLSYNETLLGAAMAGDTAGVESAIEKGACVDTQSEGGFTPLHHAVVQHDLKLARHLISLGANVNALDTLHRAPIFYAAVNKDDSMIDVLMAAGAQNLQDEHGAPASRYRSSILDKMHRRRGSEPGIA